MIELLLAGALLLSDAEDCAVLEAVINAPSKSSADSVTALVYQEPIRYLTYNRNSTVSSLSVLFGFVDNPLASDYDNADPAIRLTEANLRLEMDRPFIDESVEILPNGLEASLLTNAISREPWECDLEDGQILNDASRMRNEPTLDEYSQIRLYSLTRPAFSNDGNWAMVYRAEIRTFEQSGLARTRGQSGYVLLRRGEAGDWIVDQRINLLRYTPPDSPLP